MTALGISDFHHRVPQGRKARLAARGLRTRQRGCKRALPRLRLGSAAPIRPINMARFAFVVDTGFPLSSARKETATRSRSEWPIMETCKDAQPGRVQALMHHAWIANLIIGIDRGFCECFHFRDLWDRKPVFIEPWRAPARQTLQRSCANGSA